MSSRFEESKVTGKVYVTTCIDCELQRANLVAEWKSWKDFVLMAETKKDMKVKVEEHIMKYHGGNNG